MIKIMMDRLRAVLRAAWRPFAAIWRGLKKGAHDFALVFYDDLEFNALSLPRLILGMGAGMMFVTWIYVLWGHDFKYFPELTTFCATSMAPYSVKKFVPAILAKFKANNGDEDNEHQGNS